MNMMKNLTKTFTLAVATLALPWAASAADGNIFSIHPLDKDMETILSPVTMSAAPTLEGGDTAYFAVRLQKNAVGGNPLRIVHNPMSLSTESLDWLQNPPRIGIFVSGEHRWATYVAQRPVGGGAGGEVFYTDLIFSYTVQPGDFELPIRLSDANGKVITDLSESTKFDFSFLHEAIPSWKINDSAGDSVVGTDANLWFGEPGRFTAPSDGSEAYYSNYDFTKYPFKVQTIDFDANQADPYWRVVAETPASKTTGSASGKVVITGMPTNSATFYVWAMSEANVKLAAPNADKTDPNVRYVTKNIHFGGPSGAGEARTVAEIKVVAGVSSYALWLKGVLQGGETELVFSAFPDFQYGEVGAAAPVLVEDFLTRTVYCKEPDPASVDIHPELPRVTATATSWQNSVTELSVAFSQPFSEDVEIEIVPGFSRSGNDLPWADYIRFSEKSEDDVTLQTEPVANPKVIIRAGDTEPTVFADGTSLGGDHKLYVYALRADLFSDGSSAKLTFGVKTTNVQAAKPSSAGGIDGWISEAKPFQSTLQVVSQDPVILEPAAGAEQSATASEMHRFTIKVSDNWANMTNAYKVSVWKDKGEADFVELEGDFIPDPRTGVLYKKGTKELPGVTYVLKSTPYETSLKVKSTVSENESAPVDVSVRVTARKGYAIAAADGVTDLVEGKFSTVAITFEDIVTDDCYAFLQPVGEAAKVVTNCTWLAAAGGVGKLVRAGTVADAALSLDRFKITDGDEIGSLWDFNVVLLKQQAWSDDPDAKYGKFAQNNTLRYTVTNVRPTVAGVTPDKKAAKKVKENGGEIKGGFPVSDTVEHVFRLDVTEPGDLDKTSAAEGSRFETVWVFFNEDESDTEYYPKEEVEPDTGLVYGDPSTNTCTMVFTNPGRYRAEVRVKDKDMADYDDDEVFTFYFNVVDHPAISVRTERSYNESAVDAETPPSISLVLAENPCNFPMYAKLTIRPNIASENPGTFLLKTNTTSVVYHADATPPHYIVTIGKGSKEVELPVMAMDGTRSPMISEFAVEAELPPELNGAQTVPGSENEYPWQYFEWADTEPFTVRNDPPVLVAWDPEGGTNVYNAAAGEWDRTITFELTDVTLDFERTDATGRKTGGITVSFTGDGGKWETNITSYAEMVELGGAGFRPNFTGKSGAGKRVTMNAWDQDGGRIASMTWNFTVEASKAMQLIAHGPTTGFGASNGDRFATKAEGLGEGRTWTASHADALVSDWTTVANCAFDSMFTVYAYGYKVGDIDDGTSDHLHYPGGRTGYYVERDTPISAAGKSIAKGGPVGNYYRYVPRKDVYGREVDSFLYTWLQVLTSEGGGSGESELADAYLNGSIAPEMSETKDTGRVVTLPAEKDEEGNYPLSLVEAVFSVELYWSDNMGDINKDGIPDAYAKKYGFGIFDEKGKVSGDDLEKLTGYNEDEDYLPSGDQLTYAAYIPDLPASWATAGAAFTADMEVRGYDSHLNNAPELTGLTGVKPERVYEVDGQWSETNCTLSYLEYVAWKESGLPADQWSPERPSDPTKADTDEDGFTDGYEYYYWYRAHVGYFDEKGVHRRLTGRRYDVRNPGMGAAITPEEIEQIMDPMTKFGSADSAQLRDSDNDGLPDLLEFEIGTNPFDFDTDNDGLPDGWEVALAGLDPLRASSCLDAMPDTERNYDGDAMAITSYKLEKSMTPVPFNEEQIRFWTFATVDPAGDTDGVQWHATRVDPTEYMTVVTQEEAAAWSFVADGRTYVAYGAQPQVYTNPVTQVACLATTFAKGFGDTGAYLASVTTNEVVTADEEGNEVTNQVYMAARGWPVRVPAGLPVDVESIQPARPTVTSVAAAIDPKEVEAYAAWVYGRGTATNEFGEVAASAAEYGCLALGRELGVAEGAVVCASPSNERDVALLHYLVYQEFGFDPRTAWKAKDPLADRWGKTVDSGAVEGIIVMHQGGYAGKPARTRDYAAYDEFLVSSFFQNNGCDMSGVTFVPDEASSMIQFWGAVTTNPQGPGEPELVNGDHYFGRNSEEGADTDLDGVPDGWELYIMAGPKGSDGRFVYAPPYARFDTGFTRAYRGEGEAFSVYAPAESYWSPFVAAAKTSDTANQIYLGGQENDDLLNEFQEFEGTDTMAYYARTETSDGIVGFSRTIVHDESDGKRWTWFNKFFPTDPWNRDTDGDGIDDKKEGELFAYTTKRENLPSEHTGLTPADDGKLWSIPGGGLNPCSVDTDQDGLPDGWEAQFRPGNDYENVYSLAFEPLPLDKEQKPIIDFAKDSDDVPTGNALQGLTDAMDGTVKDANSYPVTRTIEVREDGSRLVWTVCEKVDGFRQVVNRDYDRDGLENWQEYLTGTMRCWRYDDPYSPWESLPEEWYGSRDPETGVFTWAPDLGKFGASDMDEFWYMTLVDRASPYYNPRLIVGQNQGSQYFTRVTNAWDPAYCDASLNGQSTYYYFPDRVNGEKIETAWIHEGMEVKRLGEVLMNYERFRPAPSKYISCSPIDADSDHDGMDDYYELFHGMNPLLGKSGVLLSDGGPCDLVYDAWYLEGFPCFEAYGAGDTENWWQKNPDKRGVAFRGGPYDMQVFPWLNGEQNADPDGDDLRNEEEALAGRLTKKFWHHTDPTPLWMTDSSYSNSLVRQYFRLPTGGASKSVVLEKDFFMHGEDKYWFRDFDGFVDTHAMMNRYQIERFNPDQWKVFSANEANWLFSFEENEGYDADHDGLSDKEEVEGLYRTASDPQDADAPRRRQAMYFQGPERPSALQSMPFVAERHPAGHTAYGTEFAFLQFTAECWVRPDTTADATIFERAAVVPPSNPGDQEYIRRNFELSIRNGRWCAAFDPNGTLAGEVSTLGSAAVQPGQWTHLAATYDGTTLTLFVNGDISGTAKSGLQPTTGTGSFALNDDMSFWFTRGHAQNAFLVGAAFKTNADGAEDGSALDVTQGRGWGRYRSFYKGYVDEVRVWDGARSPDEIKATMRTRFDAKLASENRTDFYQQWQNGKYRNTVDNLGVEANPPPELRYHWSFDSVFGAENERAVAVCPHGFDVGGVKAPLSRPADYEIGWFRPILDGYEGMVYRHPAWAMWIPNTVTHLPRFDGTTLDSVYWAEDAAGGVPGVYRFANAAEPLSRWTQMVRNGISDDQRYASTGTRHLLANTEMTTSNTTAITQHLFSGRNRNQSGDDLLPLGGAYAKYVSADEGGLWDDEGASSVWELAGGDGDGDGLADWWETYAEQNYRDGMDPDEEIGWETQINYRGRRITAGDAFMLDLANGAYVDANGRVYASSEAFRQTADSDHDGMPDVWEEMNGVHAGAIDYSVGHANGDPDNDGLSNYMEYLAGLDGAGTLLPLAMKSNGSEIDYFLKAGSQYLGELYSDHDMVEDWWEDKWQDIGYASRGRWDALSDGDGDGWSLFAERRYAATKASGMANLVSHLVGDNETPDMPMPTIKMTVRYNGNQLEVGKAVGDESGTGGGKTSEEADASSKETAGSLPKIYVQAYSDPELTQPDAIFSVEPGKVVSKTFFMGGWEDRVVRGTLTPGHVDFSKVDLQFAQVQQSDRYSWTDGSGLHLSGTYEEFKAALLKDPDILQNVQNFEWLHLTAPYGTYTSADKAVTVSRDGTLQKGYINLYGERVGTIDLETGDFEFDMNALANTATPYTFGGRGSASAWSYKEGVFRLTYEARVPAMNRHEFTFTLAKADEGYVREGPTAFVAFADVNGNGRYDVTEPYGVVRGVDVGWDRVPSLTVEMTDASANGLPRFTVAEAGAAVPVKVRRTAINGEETAAGDVLTRTIDFSRRNYLTEADVIRGNQLDLDWNRLQGDAVAAGIRPTDIREVTYEVSIGGEKTTFSRTFADWKKAVAVSPTVNSEHELRAAHPTFVWRGDDGYTAFEIEITDESRKPVWTSGRRLLPAKGASGYAYEAPVYVGRELENGKTYFWSVAQFNAKFSGSLGVAVVRSDPAEFRTAVGVGNGYGGLSADVRYYGPADEIVDAVGQAVSNDAVVVSLYRTADFTGTPVASLRLADGPLSSLAITNVANFADPQDENLITFVGLAPGDYYVMAFMDRNGNGRRDSFEAWGYANKIGSVSPDIYTPVAVTVADTAAKLPGVVVFMEDTAVNGTDNDSLRDLSELELDGDGDGLSDGDEESFDANPDDPDTDNDGMPDGWEARWAGTSPNGDDASYVTKDDVMAYAEVERQLVTFSDDTQCLLAQGATAPTVGDTAVSCNGGWYDAVYDYGNRIGLGLPVQVTNASVRVESVEPVVVVLVHAQVYAAFGYDTRTANAEAYAEATAAAGESGEELCAYNTKPFTALDKYLLWKYLIAIGYADDDAENALNWMRYTLVPGDADNNRDGLADGWQLYVMFKDVFGGLEEAASCTPWTDPAAARTATPDGEGILWVQEFDGGHHPTDPWAVDTDGDGVSDLYAYRYHLKGDDAGADFDGDGLSNYAEYLINEVFHLAEPKLDPDVACSANGVRDYFRKAGDLYLGEIFQDHDQVDDVWEALYPTAANRSAYDPDDDEDHDGWSNYEEFRAGTDPTAVSTPGIDGYVKSEHPVPVIAAKVVYTGAGANLGSLVFSAWNESTEESREMVTEPDAVWTVGKVSAQSGQGNASSGNSQGTGGSTASYEKYIGPKPDGRLHYALGGGSISEGSIKLCFLDKGYATCVVDAFGNITDLKAGDPSEAKWYYEVYDRGGKLVLVGNSLTGDAPEIGTVDYKTGLIDIDFSQLTGERICQPENAMGDEKDKAATSSGGSGSSGEKTYDYIKLENSYVLIAWEAAQTSATANGVYYLSDADALSGAGKSGGYVHSGKNTFFCFSDEDGNGEYTPGEPFGVARGVDVGWQGAKFTVELTETHAVSPRIRLWDDASDRDAYVGEMNYGEYNSRNAVVAPDAAVSGKNIQQPASMGESVRVRVARYAVDGYFTYSCGAKNRVIMDKYFERSARDLLCEADFLRDGEFDIDWNALYDEVCVPLSRNGHLVTNVSYLVVIGEGPSGFDRAYATNESERVTALGTVITRRFDAQWTAPRAIGLKEGSILHGARPTFVWSMPDESDYAKRFGSSYTAFRIQVVDSDTNKLLWTSDVTRAPKPDANGNFIWTAPLYVGDQTANVMPTFKKGGNYQWRVAMYNAKFKPTSIGGDTWSNIAEFSTAVDTQQETDDGNYASMDVSVKYVGPAQVLADCTDVSTSTGMVRIQAFETADFAGEPVAQGFVTNRVALTNATDVTANGRLIGLPFGTYYVRAYIDSNGNFKKDDWESWGCATEPVTVQRNQLAPIVGLFIEDADTDRDWLPDAWEYVRYGNLEAEGAKIDPEGRIVLRQTAFASVTAGKAGVSRFLSGATLTFFESLGNAKLLLGLGDDDVTTIEAIRAAVERNIDPNTVRITAMTVDAAANKVLLTVGAKTVDSIAGQILSPVYRIPSMTDVTIKVYRKDSLVAREWGDPVKTVTKTVDSNLEAVVPVDLGADVDFSSGFYKIEIVQ